MMISSMSVPERPGTRLSRITILPAMLALMLISACESPDPVSDTRETTLSPPSISNPETTIRTKQVKLDNDQLQKLNIDVQTVRQEALQFAIVAPGIAAPAPDHVAVISAPIDGIVVKIYAQEGESVKRGQVLLELESLEFADLVAALLHSQAETQYQESMVRRLRQLVERQIRPQRDLEKAESDLSRARASLQAANARLLAVGVTETQIKRWKSGSEDHPHLQIRSPIDGVITEHLIDRGQAVSAMQRIGLVVNTREVLIKGFVSPEDAALLSPGSSLTVDLRERAGEKITGKIKNIIPVLDEVNRSLTVTALLPTQDGWPRPGQNVRLEIAAKLPRPMTVVPLDAVAFDGDNATIFVQAGTESFEQRPVVIQRMTEKYAIIESGLEAGEMVAVTQVFSLKALARYDEFAE